MLFFLLFFVSLGSQSQVSNIDSLKSLLPTSPERAKSKLLLTIAKSYRYTSYDSVVSYGNQAVDYAVYLDDKDMIIESLIELAYINISIGNKQRSLLLYKQAKQACEKEGNHYLLAKVYMDIERYYSSFSDYATAISSLDTALQIISSNNLSSLLPEVYINYGNLYIILQDFTIASYYSRLAIASSRKEENRTDEIRSTLLHGKVHYHDGKYDSSLYYFYEALALAKKTNNKLLMQSAYRNISGSYIKKVEFYKANIYIDSSIIYCDEVGLPNELASLYAFKAHISSLNGDYQSTLKYNLQAYELRKEIGHRISICASLLNIGGNYSHLGDYDQAHSYLTQGIKIAEDQNALSYLVYGYEKFARLYKLEGNYEKALYYTELKTIYSDSIANQKNSQKVTFLKSQFELEKEKTATEKIKLKKKTNEAYFLIITIILSISIIILISVLYYLKKKSVKEINEAKDKAVRSDHLKSAFLANMSHEIRTPMNGILGFSELLKEPGLSGEQQQEYIRIIEKSGIRMLNIINDIISISKIESGLMSLNIEESNINEQIMYLYNFFKPEVDAKGIRFSLKNTLPTEDANILTDREKLYAIATNLVKNAIKYTENGSIEMGYTLIKDGGEVHLEFYVKDTGEGVPKDRQEAIFERFIQSDVYGNTAQQGAGLGLSISKAYVEMLGGRIWVESEAGKGSSFFFTIPYHDNAAKDKREKDKIVPVVDFQPSRKLNILIVEDDKTSELYISYAVRNIGNKILIVTRGTEAVSACLKNPDIDLVLMDIQMPEMNGYEASKQIRKFNQDVVIIAQTAFALSGDREKAIAAGCNDYITKPLNKEKLLELIGKHF